MMTTTISMDSLFSLISGMSIRDRRWLSQQLLQQLQVDEEKAKKEWNELLSSRPSWEEEDNARLDAALARISGEWGGDKTPVEIANELRQGPEMVREVETW